MATADNSYRPEKDNQFGLVVKRLLEERQLSQRKFAELAKLKPDYVSKLVNGEISEPRNSTVEKIANGLGITVSELWQRVKQIDGATEPGQRTAPISPEPPESSATQATPPATEAVTQTPQKWVVGLDVLRSVPVWVGRDALLEQLHREFVDTPEEANQPRPVVLALVGQGGIGKTSLAVKLLEAVGVDLRGAALAHWSVYAGVICFRAEEGSSFNEVAGVLLAALGITFTEPLQESEQKIQLIIQGLQQRRYLLLLDNLEVILHPASQPEAGRAVQPEWGQLLNALVHRPHQSQVILTSREVPLDLADRRYPSPEPDPFLVRIERLGGVDVPAGAEILSQRQVKDPEVDRRWVAERVAGHVFVLTQLAAVAKGRPGYLRQHPQLVTQRAEPILQEQLARQSEPARELLKRMCVLRRSADIRALTFLRKYSDDWEADNRLALIAAQQQLIDFDDREKQETQQLVDHLLNCSLVQESYDLSKCEVVYNLHQLITEFLSKRYVDALPALFQSVQLFYQQREVSKIVGSLTPDQNLSGLAAIYQKLLEPLLFAFHLGDEQEATNLGMLLMRAAIQMDQGNMLEAAMRQQAVLTENYDEASALLGMAQIHYQMGYWDAAEQYAQEALALSIAQENKSNIAPALGQLGSIERNRGNWDGAEQLFRQSLQLREELGDRAGMASSWGVLGDIERNRGNWDGAEQLFRQCLQIEEELGDRAGMASSWGVLGSIERNRGNWDGAEQLYRQSLQLREELGDRAGIASSWGVLGDIERNRGNWDGAEQLFRQSLQLQEELGDRAGIASSWGCLGETELGRGNLDNAESFLKEALAKMQVLGMTWHIAETNYDLAQLERQRGNPEPAQAYYTTAHQIFTQLGAAKDLEKIEQEWHSDGSSS